MNNEINETIQRIELDTPNIAVLDEQHALNGLAPISPEAMVNHAEISNRIDQSINDTLTNIFSTELDAENQALLISTLHKSMLDRYDDLRNLGAGILVHDRFHQQLLSLMDGDYADYPFALQATHAADQLLHILRSPHVPHVVKQSLYSLNPIKEGDELDSITIGQYIEHIAPHSIRIASILRKYGVELKTPTAHASSLWNPFWRFGKS